MRWWMVTAGLLLPLVFLQPKAESTAADAAHSPHAMPAAGDDACCPADGAKGEEPTGGAAGHEACAHEEGASGEAAVCPHAGSEAEGKSAAKPSAKPEP